MKRSVCPYSNQLGNENFRVKNFHIKTKNIFLGVILSFLFLLLMLAVYCSMQNLLLFYTTITIFVSSSLLLLISLLVYPRVIRYNFISQKKEDKKNYFSKDDKIPFYGILSNVYDIFFRRKLLLRDFDLERRKILGNIYLSFFGLRPVIIVTSANLAAQISKDILRFAKSDPRDLSMPFFYKWVGNNNIVLANGERWKKIRKLINPNLNEVQIFLPIMQDKVKIFCDKLDYDINHSRDESDFVEIKLSRWLKALSLDIAGKALFGFDFNHLDEETNSGIAATDYVLNEIFSPLRIAVPIINKLPCRSNRNLKKSMKVLDDLVSSMITYYLKNLNKRPDQGCSEKSNLLAILLEANKSNFLTSTDLRNNILALVLASHETTQVALSGALYYLAKFPDLQDKLRQESIALFHNAHELFLSQPKKSDKKNRLHAKLKSFENLENFILECLRLYSPLANQNPRTTMEEVELDDYKIPKGTLVIMNLHAIHMDEENWDGAEKFDMDRFKKGITNKYAYLPFGNGPRICSGREFSLIEQKLAICSILRKFEIRLPSKNYAIPILRYSFTGLPDETFRLCFKQIN